PLIFFFEAEDGIRVLHVTGVQTCALPISSYALGAISHFFAPAIVPMLAIIAVLVSMVCRFYRVGPPGSLFFIMAAAIGAYTPIEIGTASCRVRGCKTASAATRMVGPDLAS